MEHSHSHHTEIRQTHDHHAKHGDIGHDKHAGHNVSDFWKRFIVCSIVSIPVLALSHMIQLWLGFELSFTGDEYVLAALSTFIFVYGG